MARKVFLDEESFVSKLEGIKDFNKATGIVGIPDDKVVVAEKVYDIVNKDFEELIDMFPASTFFELREYHEDYVEGVCGQHKVASKLPAEIEKRQSPVRRRLF